MNKQDIQDLALLFLIAIGAAFGSALIVALVIAVHVAPILLAVFGVVKILQWTGVL